MSSDVRDEITYPFPNFYCATVAVWEWKAFHPALYNGCNDLWLTIEANNKLKFQNAGPLLRLIPNNAKSVFKTWSNHTILRSKKQVVKEWIIILFDIFKSLHKYLSIYSTRLKFSFQNFLCEINVCMLATRSNSWVLNCQRTYFSGSCIIVRRAGLL